MKTGGHCTNNILLSLSVMFYIISTKCRIKMTFIDDLLLLHVL